MSKFKVGDWVRVTPPDRFASDQVGHILSKSNMFDFPFDVEFAHGIKSRYKEHELTLADPDVHEVLAEMAEQSGLAAEEKAEPAAFTVGERVMVKRGVVANGGRFGTVHGFEDGGAVEWLVRLDGNPVSMPSWEDQLIHITPAKDMAEMEIDGEYVRGGTVAPDPVNHPSHYTSSPATCANCGAGIECIQITRHMGFNVGNSVKYLWRADLKNDAIEDMEKAIWYIQDEIAKRKAAQ